METQAFFENIREEIQARLNVAQKEIDLAVAWLTDRVLFETVCKKATNGISVRLLITDDDINKFLPISNLSTNGGKVYKVSERLMHNKFCVIDREVVITGSYNWTNKARNENLENITVTSGDAFFAMQFVQEFNRIVETQFGEKQNSSTDFAQITKRLELIRQLIELGDTEDLPPQYRKLKTLNVPTEITDILKLLDTKQYGDAVASITQFLKRFNAITEYIDPEIGALKLEMHALELDLINLENEKAEIEKTVRDFEIKYNKALGQLLLEILTLRKKIAEKKAIDNPEDEEAQTREEETKQDYQSYYKSYEETKAKILNVLTDADQKILKEKFREASKLCHPDVVTENFKEKAQVVFIDLKNAYDANDLEKTTNILYFLQTGKPYQTGHNTINEKIKLRSTTTYMRQQRENILTILLYLKDNTTYAQILKVTDWQTYFDNQKEALKTQLEKLKTEWTRINN